MNETCHVRGITITSQLSGIFPKMLGLITWSLAAVSACCAMLTLYAWNFPAPGALELNAFLLSFAPTLCVLMLVQIPILMLVKILLSRGYQRLAAWLFLIFGMAGAIFLDFLLPDIAPLFGILLMASFLLVIPHMQKRDLTAMQLVVATALIAMFMFSFSVFTRDVIQTALRVGGLLIGVAGSVYVFSSLYFGLIQSIRDIGTERERLERRHTYLQALQDTSASLVQRMDMNRLLKATLLRATALADTEHAFVSMLTESKQHVCQQVGIGLFADANFAGPQLVQRGHGMVGTIWNTCKTLRIEDYRNWPGAIAIADDPVRAIIGVPLMQGGEFIGVIALAHTEPDKQFLPEQIAVIEQLAELGSVAVENARLYELSRSYEAQLEQRVKERTHELSAMLRIANATNSSFDTARVFDAFFEELRELMGIESGTLLMTSGPEHVRVGHYWGPSNDTIKDGRLFAIGPHHTVVFGTRTPIIIRDVRSTSDPLALAYSNYVQIATQEPVSPHIASYMGVPVVNNDRVIGMLALAHREIGGFTEAHTALALAAAAQGAMAIVNSQLHTHTIEAATLAERSRLARDLHDSVSQAVFSMVLNAKTMEQLALIDPKRVLEPLPHVISLAEAALTEMRALIFELQPESLQKEGLISALQKQAAASRARHHLKIEEQLCAREPDAGLQVKEALYRIAVEALHNAVKYSRAQLVTLRLDDSNDRIDLQIADDGVGFDTQAVPYGHFGLRSMRERVAQLNGLIDIDSAPGHGTRIAVSIHKTPALPVRG